MKRPLKKWFSLLSLLATVVIVSLCYLAYNMYGNWSSVLALRGKELLAFIFVEIATALSTISSQTITQNHSLTPNILEVDLLYISVQTVLFSLLGGVQALGQVSLDSFSMDAFLMVFLSTSLSHPLLCKNQPDLFLLLMIDMVLGTFFSSISMFLQMTMDPNEYDLFQGKLFASPGSANSQYPVFVGVAVLTICGIPWRESYRLDALCLRNYQAQDLGVTVNQFQLVLLCLVSSLVSLSTASVGPITFLGFIVANMSYQFMKTYRYQELFVAGSLIVVFLLVFGQLMVK